MHRAARGDNSRRILPATPTASKCPIALGSALSQQLKFVSPSLQQEPSSRHQCSCPANSAPVRKCGRAGFQANPEAGCTLAPLQRCSARPTPRSIMTVTCYAHHTLMETCLVPMGGLFSAVLTAVAKSRAARALSTAALRSSIAARRAASSSAICKSKGVFRRDLRHRTAQEQARECDLL